VIEPWRNACRDMHPWMHASLGLAASRPQLQYRTKTSIAPSWATGSSLRRSMMRTQECLARVHSSPPRRALPRAASGPCSAHRDVPSFEDADACRFKNAPENGGSNPAARNDALKPAPHPCGPAASAPRFLRACRNHMLRTVSCAVRARHSRLISLRARARRTLMTPRSRGAQHDRRARTIRCGQAPVWSPHSRPGASVQ
jgi:hypothetical protein